MRLEALLFSAGLATLAGCQVSAPSEVIPTGGDSGPSCPTASTCLVVVDCEVKPDPACTTQLTAEQRGLCAGNRQLCAGSTCVDDPSNYRPTPEVCDGYDNDCNGEADEGCDSDGDGHCTTDMLVVGVSPACPESPNGQGDDCDDADPDVWASCGSCADHDGDGHYAGCDAYKNHPYDCNDEDSDIWATCATCVDLDSDGHYQLCDAYGHHIGPDCNDADPDDWDMCATCVDADADGSRVGCNSYNVIPLDCDDHDFRRSGAYAEVCYDGIDNNCNGVVDENCPAVTVTIDRSGAPYTLHPASTTSVSVGVFAAAPVASIAFAATATATSGCASGDLLASMSGVPGLNLALVLTVPPDATLDGCTFDVDVTATGGVNASDTIPVTIVDDPPTILRVVEAALHSDTGQWVAAGIAGHPLTLSVHAADADGPSLTATWTESTGALACGASCTGPLTNGVSSEILNLPAAATSLTVNVTVSDGKYIASAVILVQVRTCVFAKQGRSGDGTTPSSPVGTLAEALTLAWSQGVDVCLVGVTEFDEAVVLDPSTHAAATHHPSILGGIADPNDTTPPAAVIRIGTTAVKAVSGYAGAVANVSLRSDSPATSTVLVTGATLTLAGTTLELVSTPGGAEAAALVASGTAKVVMQGGSISVDSAATAAAGVLTTVGASATVALSGLDSISVTNGKDVSRGIVVADGSTVSATGIASIVVQTSSTPHEAVAIDVVGVSGRPAHAQITDNGTISAGAGTDTTVGIRTRFAGATTIARNDTISVTGPAGRLLTAAISDGTVTATGSNTLSIAFDGGRSSGLVISDNNAITNQTTVEGCAGPAVAVGMALVGSVGATVVGNGLGASSLGRAGVVGGVTTTDYATPTSPGWSPVAAGLWTVDVSYAAITRNHIVAGSFFKPSSGSCTVTPGAIASGLRASWRATTSGTLASSIYDGNGALCETPPATFNPFPAATACAGALVEDANAAYPPLFVNNIFGGRRGEPVVGLRLRNGAGVRAYNNTFDVGDSAVTGTNTRFAVQASSLATGGAGLANNILLVRGGLFAVAVPYREEAADTSSRLALLDHNLFFIVGDPLGTTTGTAVYASVGPAGSAASYTADELNKLVGVVEIAANRVTDPLLITPYDPGQRDLERLSSVSPARSAGLVRDGVPDHDIDNQPRRWALSATGGSPAILPVDIGSDEYVP